MINNTSKSFLVWLIMGTALFQLGTIRRDEDPILKAQTDPISLKQKTEETKDGVKGAPTPSFTYYEKEDFLSRSPMESALEEEVPNSKPQNDLDAITEVQTEQEEEPFDEQPLETGSEDVETPSEEAAGSEEDDWWVEDQT